MRTPNETIEERIMVLADEHLERRMRNRLAGIAEETSEAIGLGDWPVTVTDARVAGALGLAVLTTERLLWVPAESGHEEIDVPWSAVSAVAARYSDPDSDMAISLHGGGPDDIVLGSVGDIQWTEEVVWAARNASYLSGPATAACPRCVVDVSGADPACMLCGAHLEPVSPRAPLDLVRGRLRRFTPEPELDSLERAPAAAALAIADVADPFLWAVTSATLGSQPVVLVVDEHSLRIWSTEGDVVVLRSLWDIAIEPTYAGDESGVVIRSGSGEPDVYVERAGTEAWVHDLVARVRE